MDDLRERLTGHADALADLAKQSGGKYAHIYPDWAGEVAKDIREHLERTSTATQMSATQRFWLAHGQRIKKEPAGNATG